MAELGSIKGKVFIKKLDDDGSGVDEWTEVSGVVKFEFTPAVADVLADAFYTEWECRDNYTRATQLHQVMPALWSRATYPCAPCYLGGTRGTVRDIIIHLNDSYHEDPWDRERIADWADGLDLDLAVSAE